MEWKKNNVPFNARRYKSKRGVKMRQNFKMKNTLPGKRPHRAIWVKKYFKGLTCL